jgi:capsule polysaccharide export protein KpsC/LpsZ
MIKKLIIAGLIICGAFIVYQKFIASNTKSFLNRESTVDFMGTKNANLDKALKAK